MLPALLAASALTVPAAAHADRGDGAILRAYMQARATGSFGTADAAARDYAAALAMTPGNPMLARQALFNAIAAGDRKLAVAAARTLESQNAAGVDARAILLSDALRSGDGKRVNAEIAALEADPVFGFTGIFVRAWTIAGSGKGDALAALAAAPDTPLAKSYAAEHRPLLMLATGQRAEGAKILAEALSGDDMRSQRLRIAAAAMLQRKDGKDAALAMLGTDGAPALVEARQMVGAGRQLPGAIVTANDGVGELFVRIAVDLHRQDATDLALAFARAATFLAPANSETWLVANDLLVAERQPKAALAALAQVPADDPFADAASSARFRILVASGAQGEALAEAEAATRRLGRASDWTQLGDLYGELDRQADAAAAYGRALDIVKAGGAGQPEWTLQLLRGGAYAEADMWPEAKAALEAAYALAPDQPIVLNYLGYAQLERRENVDAAMKMIARASALQPDSAEITDSLGWAHFIQGDLKTAIPLLERAAAGQPADAAINEHLGDAYYKAGRRYEARYAWAAARVFAEGADAARLGAKIETGLTPELAAR